MVGLSGFLFTILALAGLTFAAPAGQGNVTLNYWGETVFASEPHGRGTVGLVVSCTTTFVFCIWTAVHPNIVPGCTTSQRLYYRAVMMIFSIIVPEGILVCAIGEYRAARRVKKAWDKQKWPGGGAKKQMNMQAAFFVVMGGFIVDEAVPTSADTEWMKERAPEATVLWNLRKKFKQVLPLWTDPPPPPRPFRAILTPTGFIRYMEKGLIHEGSFDQAAIDDKGKASTLGKVLAGCQALWLVVVSGMRWKAGLPLTLLEIHVLIHVIRTALIYAFWWNKPLDVYEPIRIRLGADSNAGGFPGNRSANVNALSATSSAAGRDDSSAKLYQTAIVISATTSTFSQDESSAEIDQASSRDPDTEYSALHPVVLDDFALEPLHGNQAVQADGVKKTPLHYHADESLKYRQKEPNFITLQSPQTYIAFHNKAIYDIIVQLNMDEHRDQKNHPTKEQPPLHRVERTALLLLEALLVCLTGALHAAAWDSMFPTGVERLLWRASALTMCVCSLGMFFIFNFTPYDQDLLGVLWKFHTTSPGIVGVIVAIVKELDAICLKHANGGKAVKGTGAKGRKTGGYAWHQSVIWLAGCITAFYFFSVFYITVESYLSIREAPRETFLTPSWTDYWPHV